MDVCEQTRQLSMDTIKKNILQTVTRIIGPIAKPDKIQVVGGLPKTRSGKIMRRILRKIAEGEMENLFAELKQDNIHPLKGDDRYWWIDVKESMCSFTCWKLQYYGFKESKNFVRTKWLYG